MVAFARVMNEANMAYLDDPSAWTADSEPVKAVADYTGAAADQVPGIMEGYVFLPLSEQVGAEWLGGGAADAMRSTAEFLQSAGRIDTVADDYAPFVTDEFAEAAR